jgi:outer membrane protein, heavy metal efflux system
MSAAALIALGAVTPLGSQTAGADRLLLGDVLARVQRANPRIAAARALARAAEARVPGVTRPPNPQVQLGFMNYSLPTLGPMPIVGMAQLQVMQMLPTPGKLGLAGEAADSRAAAAAERARDVGADLREQTAMAFYDLYAADRSLDVSRETLRLLRDIEAVAEAMYRVGDGRQADVLRAQVEIATMAEDTLRMQAMRSTMAARLNALLDQSMEARVGSPLLPRFPDSMPDRAWLDSVASTDRPIVRAGIDEVRGADASRRLARKELWPDLQVGVQYAQRGGMNGVERMGSVMVGAAVPMFAHDRELRMRDEAEAMAAMARADLAAMRADTRGKIGEAYASLSRARTLARLYRTTVLPQASATAASALAAYRVGTVDFMTLLDDRMTVNRYERELFALDADQGKAWAALETLTGRTLVNLAAPVISATLPGGER